MIPKLVFCGLDRAGKTTIIKTIQEGELVQTMRTIGFTMDQIKINDELLEIIDLGGQIEFRPGWSFHLNSAGIVIWVIDASDGDRFTEATNEFNKSIKYIPQTSLIVVLANKQDLDSAVEEDDIKEIFKLEQLKNKWRIFSTSSITTEGIKPAFTWIYENYSEKKFIQELDYKIPLQHTLDGTFKCVYYEAGECPTPNLIPDACINCVYGSCDNCLNQIPDCLTFFPKFFDPEK